MSGLHVLYGGNNKPQSDSDTEVSYWHLPGGYDVVNARAVTVYFADRADAEAFCARYSGDPHRALIVTKEPA